MRLDWLAKFVAAAHSPAHNTRVFPEKKKPSTLNSKVLGSGDVLLIRKLPFAHMLPSQA